MNSSAKIFINCFLDKRGLLWEAMYDELAVKPCSENFITTGTVILTFLRYLLILSITQLTYYQKLFDFL